MAASRRHLVPALLISALSAGALALSACGGTSREPDLANGKAKFTVCAGCHSLADAGATATVGPDLDDAFRGAREQGFRTSSFEGLIKYWVQNPEQRTQPIMKPNLVTGDDLDDLAAYIVSVAGTKSDDSPARPAEPIE